MLVLEGFAALHETVQLQLQSRSRDKMIFFIAYSTTGGASSVQLLSGVQLCDPMNRSMPGLSVHHQLLESTQTYVH